MKIFKNFVHSLCVYVNRETSFWFVTSHFLLCLESVCSAITSVYMKQFLFTGGCIQTFAVVYVANWIFCIPIDTHTYAIVFSAPEPLMMAFFYASNWPTWLCSCSYIVLYWLGSIWQHFVHFYVLKWTKMELERGDEFWSWRKTSIFKIPAYVWTRPHYCGSKVTETHCVYLDDHTHNGQQEDSSGMGRRPAIDVITSCQIKCTTIRLHFVQNKASTNLIMTELVNKIKYTRLLVSLGLLTCEVNIV